MSICFLNFQTKGKITYDSRAHFRFRGLTSGFDRPTGIEKTELKWTLIGYVDYVIRNNVIRINQRNLEIKSLYKRVDRTRIFD